MYFKVPRLIAELSAGHDAGAGRHHLLGHARRAWASRARPPEFLKPGDLLETEIEGIGVLRNPVG